MKFIQKNPLFINKWLFLYKDKKKSYDTNIKHKRAKQIDNNGKEVILQNNYDKIVNDLLAEQGYICAYCMRELSSDNTTIEHIIGQEYIDEKNIEIGKEKILTIKICLLYV